jgi:exonuclease III
MARFTKRNKHIQKKNRKSNKNRRNCEVLRTRRGRSTRILQREPGGFSSGEYIQSKKQRGGDKNQITVVSYNILDVELESNFVPRTIDNESKKMLQNILLDNSKIPDNLLVSDKSKIHTLYDLAGNLYSSAFHAGGIFEGGIELKKSDARKAWGNEIAREFSKGDKITYNLRKMLTYDFIKEIRNESISFTEDDSNYIFDHILKVNNEQRKWSIRSKKIVERLKNSKADIICLQEYGNCKNKSMVDDTIIGEDASEGDNLKYSDLNKRLSLDTTEQQNAKTRKNTLPYELIKLGYEYRFFGYNADTRNGDDGVAIFYKKDKFSFKDHVSIGMDSEVVTKYEKTKKPYKSLRRAGLLVLEQPSAKNHIIICTAHLQSDSNEQENNPSDKKYPVKSLELKAISTQLKESYNVDGYNNPAIIFCGDFNLKKDVLESSSISGLGAKTFELVSEPNTDTEKEKNKTPADSLSEAKELFALSRVEGTPEFKFTTYSSRSEYIDYFYSNRKGIIDTTEVYQDEKEMPNETEPSDHIMLTCKFDIN